jgi:hypothetical protein
MDGVVKREKIQTSNGRDVGFFRFFAAEKAMRKRGE